MKRIIARVVLFSMCSLIFGLVLTGIASLTNTMLSINVNTLCIMAFVVGVAFMVTLGGIVLIEWALNNA